MKKYTHQLCNNCGKQGHLFQDCKMPIISIGIILVRNNTEGELEYLMIRRKDSFGYSDFMRGKYQLQNEEYLLNIINEMTDDEKSIIVNGTPDMNPSSENSSLAGSPVSNSPFGKTEDSILRKWNTIRNGIVIHENESYNLATLVERSTTNWKETEWGFPKGRRNAQERDLECGLREFEEETGYSRRHIHLIENVTPYEEIFSGSNYKSYKHKYYLAYMKEQIDILDEFQESEVSKIEWKSYQDAISSIRSYNLEKIKMLTRVNKCLNMYKII